MPALGIGGRDVVFSLARYRKARLGQNGDNAGPVFNDTPLNRCGQVGVQLLAGMVGGQALAQGRGVLVGRIARLKVPLPLWIVRPRPAVCRVLPVPQRVIISLPAGRGDVEAFAGLQIDAGGQDVDVHSPLWLVVLHGRPGVAVSLQARPGGGLKFIEDGRDVGGGGLVLWSPGKNPGGVRVGELQPVGDGGHQFRVATEHADARPFFALGIKLAGQVGGGAAGAGPATGKFNVHRRPPGRSRRPRTSPTRGTGRTGG